MPLIQKNTLPNGVTLYLDDVPHFRSASVVIALIGGSRCESAELNGATHLIEHLLFKKSSRLSAKAIAEKIDDFGGDINAFTDAESFCLYGSVIRERVLELLEFLSELILDPQFSDADVVLEKEIVRQEIIEAHDDTADVVSQEFRECFWKDDPLGRPVFGTAENLERFTPEVLREYLKAALQGRRVIVALSGVTDQGAVTARVQQLFGALEPGDRPQFSANIGQPQIVQVRRPGQQTHLIVGWEWPAISSPKYLAGLVLATLLGHGASSRLFQVLREEQGLCYDLGVNVDAFPDTAVCLFTSSFESANYPEICRFLRREIELVCQDGVAEQEFERTKRMIRAQLEMEDDSSRGKLWRATESEIALGKFVSADEVIQKLELLNRSTIEETAREYLRQQTFAVVGGKIPKKVEEGLRW